MTGPGRYVVLEGGEGAGKTTQVERLAKRLDARGVRAEIVREPGGDPFAEAGRDLLLGPLARSPEAEVLAFNALRAQLLTAVVHPALAAGTWVLSDRSRLSTVTYQGHGHGLDLAWTRAVCALTSQLCAPDVEIVLVVDEATAAARRSARGTTDRFERLDAAFHRRVAEGYRVEAAIQGLPVVDGNGPEDAVADAVWEVLMGLGLMGLPPVGR
jgi:dTMP kinase